MSKIIKKHSFFKKLTTTDIIAILLTIVFIIVGILVSVHRYKQFEVFYIDFGVYDQAIWEVAHFQLPLVDHFIYGFIPIFADHFAPSVFLLSPFYWLTSSKVMILYAQAIAVGLSGLVLYSLSKEVIKDKFVSLTIIICYFLFVGLQNAVITEFHELTVMTLFFMLTFWAFLKKKRFLYFIFLIITLGFKESTFLLGIALGASVYFIDKKWRKEAVATILISSIWGIITLKMIIPYFSHGQYIHAENIPDTLFDKINAMFNSPLKIHTVFFSFLSFGFLPFISPQFWLLMLQDYGSRFETKYGTTRWDLGLHYNSQSAVILAIAAVYGFCLLMRFGFFKRHVHTICLLLIFNAIFLNRFILHGPFNLVYNPAFYRHTYDFAFLETIITKVPPTATVATHSNLAAKFTHQRVWLLKKDYESHNPDYIFIDNRAGQNPNDFFGTGEVTGILKSLSQNSKYQVIYKTSEQFLYRKKN